MTGRITHSCPVAGCTFGQLPRNILMCRKHWAMVPRRLKDAVYREWHLGSPSPQYWDVREQAIAAAEGR